ncbi:hypothetical protein GGI11_001569 [Coemansia sp. RSA 2049]|nr:hypothetical protein H4217_005367 [Coemansia sp. RSA 1939]KAJ2523043.1 hypothetical protein GGI11_001569 [Coemansia sp. RSA 2049]KAJ2617679.1 hypothetical protein EV177_000445 [Coemansia sp. RSA 1804]KAJ2695400.1 hypothetical protein GGH99_000129 [Coemansia sp. RSA 1285]
MRSSAPRLYKKAASLVLASKWKPRAAEAAVGQRIASAGRRHPERFSTQIVLSDGSSFRVRSTAPREQVKITKDTRSHPLWNPQVGQLIDDEGGYLASFQKKFQGFEDLSFSFADAGKRRKSGSRPNKPATQEKPAAAAKAKAKK